MVLVAPIGARAAIRARAALGNRWGSAVGAAVDPRAPVRPRAPLVSLLCLGVPAGHVPRRDRHADARGDQPGDGASVEVKSPHSLTVPSPLTRVKSAGGLDASGITSYLVRIPTNEETMFARVATFEGADPSMIDANVEQIREGGRPEGVPASGYLFLVDRDAGKTISIVLFDSEDDLRQGNEAFNAMSPPVGAGMGTRTSVETYEVPLQMS